MSKFLFVHVGEWTLVKCPVSGDTIGAVTLENGKLEFWRRAKRRLVTTSFAELFAYIERASGEI